MLEIAKKEALRFYRALAKKDPTIAGGEGFSPAAATKSAATKSGIPASRLVPVVAEIFYRENGTRFPLPKSAAKGRASFARAVAARRNAGGRLGRWEVVAYSAAATLGRPVSVATVRAAYAEAGYVLEASYTGRGTRAGAPETRTDEVAEIVSATDGEA